MLHRSGEEGIDELWGEPFKAFAFPVEEFYRSRYMKIALTMRDIDRICDELVATFGELADVRRHRAADPRFREGGASIKSETLRTDPDIFDVWTSFVVAGRAAERVRAAALVRRGRSASAARRRQGMQLVMQGKDSITYITRARVPMPKSTAASSSSASSCTC